MTGTKQTLKMAWIVHQPMLAMPTGVTCTTMKMTKQLQAESPAVPIWRSRNGRISGLCSCQ